MIKKVVYIFLVFFVVISAKLPLKSLNDELRFWSPTKKLTWEDYRGVPDSLSTYQALTFSQIEYEIVQEGSGYLNIKVTNSFIKNASWSKNKSNQTLLEHENLHFDISELVTRKIRMEFTQYKMFEKQKTYDDLRSLFKYYGGAFMDSVNHKYDFETSHGTILEKQKEWEAKIDKELKALDKFASTTVVVKKKPAKSISRKKKKWWKFW